ncbi:retrovirus-related Pol polyprotein from transposon TNT 1-94 [Trichonephila clavipes]|nr:retrovirus-related Pol polyprotein from transposon TNT 1-94 [Trichonephila clavipes]
MYLSVSSATLESYNDSDYAGDPLTRRSTSRMAFKYNEDAIAWRSQRQNCIVLSATEAEFIAASQAVKKAIWLNNLLKELCCVNSVPRLQIDNQSAIRLVNNPGFHNRTKHIDIRYKFIKKYEEWKRPFITPAGLLKLVKRFEETGKLEDRAQAGRPCLKEARAPCIAVKMEAIASEAASGTSSAREAARRLGLPPSSVRNILRRLLQLYPHKLQSCHELLPADTA